MSFRAQREIFVYESRSLPPVEMTGESITAIKFLKCSNRIQSTCWILMTSQPCPLFCNTKKKAGPCADPAFCITRLCCPLFAIVLTTAYKPPHRLSAHTHRSPALCRKHRQSRRHLHPFAECCIWLGSYLRHQQYRHRLNRTGPELHKPAGRTRRSPALCRKHRLFHRHLHPFAGDCRHPDSYPRRQQNHHGLYPGYLPWRSRQRRAHQDPAKAGSVE